MLAERKDAKHDKLVQYAQRVWSINEGSESEQAEAAIEKTRAFFESLGVKTRLGDYQLAEEHIEPLVNSLEAHGMTALGEHNDVTPDVCRRVLHASL